VTPTSRAPMLITAGTESGPRLASRRYNSTEAAEQPRRYWSSVTSTAGMLFWNNYHVPCQFTGFSVAHRLVALWVSLGIRVRGSDRTEFFLWRAEFLSPDSSLLARIPRGLCGRQFAMFLAFHCPSPGRPTAGEWLLATVAGRGVAAVRLPPRVPGVYHWRRQTGCSREQ
jgi:hypothetical protein